MKNELPEKTELLTPETQGLSRSEPSCLDRSRPLITCGRPIPKAIDLIDTVYLCFSGTDAVDRTRSVLLSSSLEDSLGSGCVTKAAEKFIRQPRHSKKLASRTQCFTSSAAPVKHYIDNSTSDTSFNEIFVQSLSRESENVSERPTTAVSLSNVIADIIATGTKNLVVGIPYSTPQNSFINREDLVREISVFIYQHTYQFHFLKSAAEKGQTIHQPVFSVHFVCDSSPAIAKAIAMGSAQGQGMNYARDLANLPSNICTPAYLSLQARLLAERYASTDCTVLGEAELDALGLKAFTAVSKGSTQEGQLIELRYQGNTDPSAGTHVLIGKGVTFDSGGIALKQGPQMTDMKFDMCGAASVLGTILALAELAANINVTALIAAAENMPGPCAMKPGDIIETLSGATVEVLDTDAEGRLMLCDTLTYAERFGPVSVVDIATLCLTDLGRGTSALYSNNNQLATDLMIAGQLAKDPAWLLPLAEEYENQTQSDYADMANIGSSPSGGIIAANFLARFAKKLRWAHIDIGGTAWNSRGVRGASGRPVPLLIQYFLQKSA